MSETASQEKNWGAESPARNSCLHSENKLEELNKFRWLYASVSNERSSNSSKTWCSMCVRLHMEHVCVVTLTCVWSCLAALLFIVLFWFKSRDTRHLFLFREFVHAFTVVTVVPPSQAQQCFNLFTTCADRNTVTVFICDSWK